MRTEFAEGSLNPLGGMAIGVGKIKGVECRGNILAMVFYHRLLFVLNRAWSAVFGRVRMVKSSSPDA